MIDWIIEKVTWTLTTRMSQLNARGYIPAAFEERWARKNWIFEMISGEAYCRLEARRGNAPHTPTRYLSIIKDSQLKPPKAIWSVSI